MGDQSIKYKFPTYTSTLGADNAVIDKPDWMEVSSGFCLVLDLRSAHAFKLNSLAKGEESM
jgi:hypothetical protein